MEQCPLCMTHTDGFPCKNCAYNPSNIPRGSLSTGTELSEGRYEIKQYLAAGGMGVVYRAFDRATERDCILKELLDQGSPDGKAQHIAMFQREAELLSGLHHPHIAEVWDSFEDGGRYYLAEEFISGGSLSDFKAPLPEVQVLRYAVQIAAALDYLHQRKIIYRDLKPDNILLREDKETVVLADFGIARIFKPGQQGDTQRFATMGYAPPEQLSTSIQTTPASDIYALGVTLYRLLTGREPGEWPTDAHGFFADFPPLKTLRADVSNELASIVEQCVKIKLVERYPNGGALLAALDPLYQRYSAVRCATCGHQNHLEATSCDRCHRPLEYPQAWAATIFGGGSFRARAPLKQLWGLSLGASIRGAPTLANGELYVASETGTLFRIDLAGQILERRSLGCSSRSTPLLDRGLWLGTEQGLITPRGLLLNKLAFFAPPLLHRGHTYALSYDGTIFAVNAQNRILWRFQLGGRGILPLQTIGNDLLALSSDGTLVRLGTDGSVRFQHSVGAKVYSAPLIMGERILLLDHQGNVQMWDAERGERLAQRPCVGESYAGLSGTPDSFVAIDANGHVVTLDFSLKELWHTSLRVGANESFITTPLATGGYFFIGSRSGTLYVLEQRSGRIVDHHQQSGGFVSPVVADGNAIFAVTDEGEVQCFLGHQ